MTFVAVWHCLECDAFFARLPAGEPSAECEGQCTLAQVYVLPDAMEQAPAEGFPQGEDGPQGPSARSPVGNPAPIREPTGWEKFLNGQAKRAP